MFRISDTPMEHSLQKLAKIENLHDRGFRISDTSKQPSVPKLAKIENLQDRGFRISDTPNGTQFAKTS